MVLHWSLSNSKSPQVSRTLLSILADLNNAVVISKSSSLYINPLVTLPRALITIIIISIAVEIFYSCCYLRIELLELFSYLEHLPYHRRPQYSQCLKISLFPHNAALLIYQILLSSGRVDTATWMHYMDAI